jgi:hypothetical protein
MQSQRIIVLRKTNDPIVWVVDSEQWPRACLRAELIERGYDPYGFIAIDDALQALSHGQSPKPEVLILELRGQDLTEERIEAITDLNVPTIVLGGSPELNDPRVTRKNWHVVMRRPFSLGDIADNVTRLRS